MMTRRKRISIIVLILLILLLLFLWLLYVLFAGKEQEVAQVQEVQEVEEVQEVVPDRPTVSEVELEEEREVRVSASDVTSLTKTFVTRYGSYSSEAECANLGDVLPLMTASFAATTQKMIDGCDAPEEYYGVSTSIVTVSVDEKDETAGTADVTVMTQREEAMGSPQNSTVKYQEIVLSFVMEGGSWKVDSASWQ
jgi:cytoskeletal protein RodZ